MIDLLKPLKISSAGMNVQTTRLRVLAENIANADSIPETAGTDPYRRKVVTFKNALDRSIGIETVRINKVTTSKGEFQRRYDPTHPAADKDGYVQLPNVNALVEMMDFREAQQSYQANLGVLDVSKRMLTNTIDLLRS
jgi:flagellar basal-body rod protein FlgC